MRKPSSNFLLLLTLLLAVGMIAYVLWRSQTVTDGTTRVGFQDADIPLSMPGGAEPDPRFQMLSAWRSAGVPTATRFDHPLGSQSGALAHRSATFGKPPAEGQPPPAGDALDGIGGENTDLGDPVFAIADGLVLYAGEPSSEWGNVVVLGHRTASGELLQSLYGHLGQIHVQLGQLVPRGAGIGTVGTANGHVSAQLHFQIRKGNGPVIGDSPLALSPTLLDPTATLEKLRGESSDHLAPSPLARALATDAEPWTQIEIMGAERLSELSNGSE